VGVFSNYRERLQQRARSASPGMGWYSEITRVSLPWVLAIIPAIVVGALTSAPLWLLITMWALPFVGWLFVQFTFLAEMIRAQKERQ
jgi:hypothetical protein